MILKSRDNKVTMEMAPLCTSFSLIDATPETTQAFSNLRWYNASSQFGKTSGAATMNATLCFVAYEELNSGFTSQTGLGGVKIADGNAIYLKTWNQQDSWGKQRGVQAAASAGYISATGIYANRPTKKWTFYAITIDSANNVGLYVDGQRTSVLASVNLQNGVVSVGFPMFIKSASLVGDTWWDQGLNGDQWPQMRFALGMGFSKVLSQQELLDLHGAIMFGKGHAISREKLEWFVLARRDALKDDSGSIVDAPEINLDAGLPAYTAVGTHRCYIRDLSGKNRHPKLFTNKADWATLMDTGLSTSNPEIFFPREWHDYSFNYDGTNEWTKNSMKIGYIKSSFE